MRSDIPGRGSKEERMGIPLQARLYIHTWALAKQAKKGEASRKGARAKGKRAEKEADR